MKNNIDIVKLLIDYATKNKISSGPEALYFGVANIASLINILFIVFRIPDYTIGKFIRPFD